MYNKKVLQTAVKELDKAKAPAKRKDIITDPMGQWKYPGQVTRIPSNTITMQGVDYPVYGVPDKGEPMMMMPGVHYNFPGADYVDEYPQMRKGGGLDSKKYTRNIEGTNYLFATSDMFKKPKKLSKKRIYHPNAKYYEEGGETDDYVDVDLTDEEIEAYREGGYIVEDIEKTDNTFKTGGATNDIVEKELSLEEIKHYINNGYIIEEID